MNVLKNPIIKLPFDFYLTKKNQEEKNFVRSETLHFIFALLLVVSLFVVITNIAIQNIYSETWTYILFAGRTSDSVNEK